MSNSTPVLESTYSLINRGLSTSINIREINLKLNKLFQRYSVALSEITGNEVFNPSHMVRRLKTTDGISVEYGKGKIFVRNGMDRLMFLMQNRSQVESALGLPNSHVSSNIRDLVETQKTLSRMERLFDLGNTNSYMQLYISRHDSNTGDANLNEDWIDYIMTKPWVDRLARASIGSDSETETNQYDTRIKILSNMLHGMVVDHELDFHSSLDTFNPDEFLDKTSYKPGGDALEPLDDENMRMETVRKLNSFGKLNYGFYEMFKPLGGTTERYVKVKLSTSGELDISGVIALSDCEHVPWEYGSMEYLRSLNTGNQCYDFKISMPFNNLNSELWWKPDDKEPLEPDPDNPSDEVKHRYFRPYETERFLRWFGTNYIPIMDPDSVVRKTICSSPRLSNDVMSEQFHSDATNIMVVGMDLTRSNMDNSTSLSLLSMSPKSTIDLVSKEDGQYLRMIVTGNMQTSNLAFHLTGKMYNKIQEMNHFTSTWHLLRDNYLSLEKSILALDVSTSITPMLTKVWNAIHPGEKWIPDDWTWLRDTLKSLQRPNVIDLLRLRQLDILPLFAAHAQQEKERMEFLEIFSKNDSEKTKYMDDHDVSEPKQMKILASTINKPFKDEHLLNYINDFDENHEGTETDWHYIRLSDTSKENLVREPLRNLYRISELDASNYRISFDDVTVDELRTSIETFNNLIVRLPVNTYANKIASRNIFLDWKGFVDGATRKMVENGKEYHNPETTPERKDEIKSKCLYVMEFEDGTWKTTMGTGTDKDYHEFTELYTDPTLETPLIDYSYCQDENGNIIHDRWDYWSVDDFQ